MILFNAFGDSRSARVRPPDEPRTAHAGRVRVRIEPAIDTRFDADASRLETGCTPDGKPPISFPRADDVTHAKWDVFDPGCCRPDVTMHEPAVVVLVDGEVSIECASSASGRARFGLRTDSVTRTEFDFSNVGPADWR
ncbi:MAG: hypothetical protein HYR85_19690 [Planctomycetes bacterium]|nr:hypothetical protein [Planctomycetota bacterium]